VRTTPEPVPPDEPDDAEIVTTDGTTFAAIAVVWLTESVLLTVTFCGVESRPSATAGRSRPGSRAADTRRTADEGRGDHDADDLARADLRPGSARCSRAGAAVLVGRRGRPDL
jgi:hypothetical protein